MLLRSFTAAQIQKTSHTLISFTFYSSLFFTSHQSKLNTQQPKRNMASEVENIGANDRIALAAVALATVNGKVRFLFLFLFLASPRMASNIQ